MSTSIRLTKLRLCGFKTIRSLDSLELRGVNVLIGANGSGKSNLVAFFRLLSWMTASPGNLQLYIGKNGGASALLHDGAAVTPQLVAELHIETSSGRSEYCIRLFHASLDTLIFADEKYRYTWQGSSESVRWQQLGSGHREAQIIQRAEQGDMTARTILGLLKQCMVYQFHNTSETARIRQKWSVEDDRYLKEDGANLAPFLWRIRESYPDYYSRITETIRQIVPFFADFELEPVDGTLSLKWRERNSDVVFGPHQASDGMLRAMALTALLLQPEDNLPNVIILDEPELGLHPYALGVVAGLLKSVSHRAQVMLATQSVALIDHFDPQDIIVVDRHDRESTFRRLQEGDLREWLDEYTLGELWEKNVIGGRPG